MASWGKYSLVFLGGVAVGAVGLALLGKGKVNLDGLKPLATDIISKGMDIKDKLMAQVDALREDMEDMAAEARDQADARRVTTPPTSTPDKSA